MDFFSDEVRRNPYPIYQQLRAAGPVFREPRSGLWMLLGYDDVRRALNDPNTFSSAASPPGTLTAEWLIFSDPPRHTRLRSLIMRAFTPRAVASLEARIEAVARMLLDRAEDGDEIELVSEFAMPLTLMVIAEMLGAPADEYPRFRRWSDALGALSHTVSRSARAAVAIEQVRAVNAEMREYVGALVEARRREPRADLLTRLCQPDDAGQTLTNDEILGFFQLLIFAGHETTTNLIANTLLCLLEHPDQLALLRVASDLLPTAIEEVLRYRSPVQAAFRVTHTEARVGTMSIPPGNLVLLMLGAANHDPTVFEHAQSFDVTRNPNPHIAFGHGVHFCIGSVLARMESRIALRLLLDRWSRFERASSEPWEPREAFHVHGPSRLPMRFERRADAVSA